MGQRYPLFNRDRIVYEYHNEYLRIGADDDDTVQIKNHTEIWMELIRLSDGTNDLESICSVFYGTAISSLFSLSHSATSMTSIQNGTIQNK